MNADVDKFIKNSEKWQKEMTKLRAIITKTKLEESLKWNLPCYSYNNHNVIIIQPFKTSLKLMFFKGVLLKDPKKLLKNIGPHSRVGKRLELNSVEEITKLTPVITALIKEAIAAEESGKKVVVKKKATPIPPEFQTALNKNPKLKEAFEALTPGRQRGYIWFFTNAKQSATREARIKKCIPDILKGKGWNER